MGMLLSKGTLKFLLLAATLYLATVVLLPGCSIAKSPVKHIELAENKVVKTKGEYNSSLFDKRINTKGYTNLRVFAHIHNANYKGNPIGSNAYFQIIAYYGIGQGSWGYHSEKFKYRSTSGWAGVANIPVVGEFTRVGIIASHIKNTELKVDVAATLY